MSWPFSSLMWVESWERSSLWAASDKTLTVVSASCSHLRKNSNSRRDACRVFKSESKAVWRSDTLITKWLTQLKKKLWAHSSIQFLLVSLCQKVSLGRRVWQLQALNVMVLWLSRQEGNIYLWWWHAQSHRRQLVAMAGGMGSIWLMEMCIFLRSSGPTSCDKWNKRAYTMRSKNWNINWRVWFHNLPKILFFDCAVGLFYFKP